MITLDSPEWNDLTDAYGTAEAIPALLKQLSEFPSGTDYRDEPWFSLWSALCHQGDVYSASFAAVPFIVAAIESDPLRASFDYFALPTSIELARVGKNIAVPEELAERYFQALTRLPSLATPLLRPGCDDTLCQALLAAIAVGVGQHRYAELLTEIDKDSIPEVLELFFNRH